MIEPDNQQLSIRTQCALLQLNRSSYYYKRKPVVSADDLWLMKEIDKIYTQSPFYGYIRITKKLQRGGIKVNHKRVYRLMKIMGIEGVSPKKNLSQPNKNHQIYPYLLKGVLITYPNQVWGADITYIKLKNDWLYLFVVLDWFSRYILAWELSDSLSSSFCCLALERALKINIPFIHNSDQGSQMTDKKYLSILKSYPTIKISMDGRGRVFDNIFTERIWRTVKYEEVYLKDYQTPKEAKSSLAEYIKFYNEERLHQSLNYQTPAEIYFAKPVKGF